MAEIAYTNKLYSPYLASNYPSKIGSYLHKLSFIRINYIKIQGPYMKFCLSMVFILFTLFLQINQTRAKTIYRWVDKSGKQHFSDKEPISNSAVKFQGNLLISINMVQLKPIKSKKLPKRRSAKRNNNRSVDKLNRCEKLKHKIESIENKLKQHLIAEKSDQYSRELNDLRWQKIKLC